MFVKVVWSTRIQLRTNFLHHLLLQQLFSSSSLASPFHPSTLTLPNLYPSKLYLQIHFSAARKKKEKMTCMYAIRNTMSDSANLVLGPLRACLHLRVSRRFLDVSKWGFPGCGREDKDDGRVMVGKARGRGGRGGVSGIGSTGLGLAACVRNL